MVRSVQWTYLCEQQWNSEKRGAGGGTQASPGRCLIQIVV
jgi:hypothetical protein